MNSDLQYDPIDSCPMDISDEDIMEAMKSIHGYLDVTPGDFKEVYIRAYRHAYQRLTASTRSRDIMTKEVIYVTPDTTLKETAETMARNDISGLPVVDANHHVVGIISEKDFLSQMDAEYTGSFMSVIASCLTTTGCSALTMRNQMAADIMSRSVVAVTETATVSEVAEILTGHSINRAPVTDENGKLLGIITRTDLIRSTCAIGDGTPEQE